MFITTKFPEYCLGIQQIAVSFVVKSSFLKHAFYLFDTGRGDVQKKPIVNICFDPKSQTQHHHSMKVTPQYLVPYLSICTVGLSAVAVGGALTSAPAIMSGLTSGVDGAQQPPGWWRFSLE